MNKGLCSIKRSIPKLLNGTYQSKCKLSHITTPIFYPNAKPHLGHLYSSLLCDWFHRWQILMDPSTPSLFTTGTDEHGLKIQIASKQHGYDSPKEFVDRLCKDFKDLDNQFEIEYTRFIRTTDPDHIVNVRTLWQKCMDNGFIYKAEHKGWYSVSDETFYPPTKVIKDPKSGKHLNTESYNEVQFHSEINYYFRLSKFQSSLITYIQNYPSFIVPSSKRDQILKELESEKLQDLSVSRPATRLKWGIEVPNDPSQKIYVWFDALCNYLSSIGKIESISNNRKIENSLHKSVTVINDPAVLWSNTIHVIGKDIARFHCIYWPCFLMAIGLSLPKRIVVHSHWLNNKVKMSKSLKNVVDPITIGKHYGYDVVRFFLLENSKLEDDGDFQETKLHSTSELLASKWGNLINRCCSPNFNIKRAVKKFAQPGSDITQLINLFEEDEDQALRENINKVNISLKDITGNLNIAAANFNSSAYIKFIWSIINEANATMQTGTPWTRKIDEDQQDAIIYLCIEASRITALLSQPLVPHISQRFLDHINVSRERRTISYAKLFADDSYGHGSNEKGRKLPLTRVKIRES